MEIRPRSIGDRQLALVGIIPSQTLSFFSVKDRRTDSFLSLSEKKERADVVVLIKKLSSANSFVCLHLIIYINAKPRPERLSSGQAGCPPHNTCHSENAKASYNQWGLCQFVIIHTNLLPSPVILWIELGGKPKWLPMDFEYHDVMHTAPIYGTFP